METDDITVAHLWHNEKNDTLISVHQEIQWQGEDAVFKMMQGFFLEHGRAVHQDLFEVIFSLATSNEAFEDLLRYTSHGTPTCTARQIAFYYVGTEKLDGGRVIQQRLSKALLILFKRCYKVVTGEDCLERRTEEYQEEWTQTSYTLPTFDGNIRVPFEILSDGLKLSLMPTTVNAVHPTAPVHTTAVANKMDVTPVAPPNTPSGASRSLRDVFSIARKEGGVDVEYFIDDF